MHRLVELAFHMEEVAVATQGPARGGAAQPLSRAGQGPPPPAAGGLAARPPRLAGRSRSPASSASDAKSHGAPSVTRSSTASMLPVAGLGTGRDGIPTQ